MYYKVIDIDEATLVAGGPHFAGASVTKQS
jgi:hypothetical protein